MKPPKPIQRREPLMRMPIGGTKQSASVMTASAEPDPPGARPEVVIGQRRERADDQPDAEPDCLAFDEEVDVAVAVLRERARAEEHHDADHQHPEHGEEQDVGALAMHRGAADAALAVRLLVFGAVLAAAFCGGMISFCPICSFVGS